MYQVRYHYKARPSVQQAALMDEWLITLRKHRNYSLKEREDGWNTNNRDADKSVDYAFGAYCDIDSRTEWGSCCPLTCPVIKHGVLSVPDEKLIKVQKKTGAVHWDSASGIQSKRTTTLRHENRWYSRVNSDVLQRNLAKLDAAYRGFWNHQRGFPTYRRAATFHSFEYKPKKYTIGDGYVYLPGIGQMRYFDSRPFPEGAEPRTLTVKREADGFYLSVLLKLPGDLPPERPKAELTSNVSFDVGINQLASLSDGSHIENPKLATNKRIRRRLRIRQRRVNRKVKGSRNRAKAGKAVAKTHQKIRHQRAAIQWKAAHKIVQTADSVTHENLNIKNMKARCQPKPINGRFMPNGQSAKRGLNRSISDAAWGGLFQKVGWLARKSGKPVFKETPRFSSQECRKCHHVAKDNRSGEKFICQNCGHIEHADTQASRNLQRRTGLIFVSKDAKNLPVDCGKVTTVRDDSAVSGKRGQGSNPISKAMPETGILEQLELFAVDSSPRAG